MTTPDNKPFPVRLGELKQLLREEASEQDRSIHWLIKKIIKLYFEGKTKV